MTPKPSDSSPKSAVPKSDAVYRILKRAILDQAFAAGTKLPEDSIGERLGVSRTIVRQVLARLNGEGLFELRPNKGACVSHPSLEDGHNIFAVRRALETLVVDSLISRLTAPKIKQLEARRRQGKAQQSVGLDPTRRRVPRPARTADGERDPIAIRLPNSSRARP
ncbi:GntR family transcriptional regulator [Ensifer sp. 4252]|uniref:GntR family transcriptional regulator n=1 Tax=Ensifer sp. 4252 TaxID=3373915 RepID=UPI003D1E0BA3